MSTAPQTSTVHVTGKARRWLASGHPWVYRDDVARTEAEPGDLVAVVDPQGKVLGHALFSAASRITLRFVTRESERPGPGFWADRIARAIEVRAKAGLLDPDAACRLVAGDADLVPGFVLDRYARTLVVQSGTLAADRLRDELVAAARAALPFEVECVVDKSDTSARKLEELDRRVEVLHGSVPAEVIVRESGLEYAVDVMGGHKTGHYLDQRENRLRAAEHARSSGVRSVDVHRVDVHRVDVHRVDVSSVDVRGVDVRGVDVLDAFSYDGLFGIRAALAGARSVVCVDQSKEALERAAANAERNKVGDRVRFVRANCMHDLRARAEEGQQFGLVIVDPPAFAKSRREVQGAERGYVELNRRAFTLTAPGGMLVSASCSYNVRAADFQGYLARAAHLAGRDAWLTEMRGAGADHPVLLTLPETSYLKCAFVRVG